MPKPQGPHIPRDPWELLTSREQEVMTCLLRGAANKVIAAELGISQRTVESHRSRLFRKLRVRNIAGLFRVMYTAASASYCVSETTVNSYNSKRPHDNKPATS